MSIPKRGKVILVCCFIFGLTYSGAFYFGVFSSFPDSQDELSRISSVGIIYKVNAFSPNPFTIKYYRIANIGGNYYTMTGKKIDPHLIQSLAESFTDFYESATYEDSYDRYFMFDYYPHFTVEILLENGKSLVMKTDSNYHCFIPWNIEYDGKTYVQYNGKIPHALLTILAEIDEEWTWFDNEIRRGCHPAAVPDRYFEVSSDFPETIPVVTPEEVLGKTHLLWEVDVEGLVFDSPHYVNGRVLVTTRNKVVSLDCKTGEKVWEAHFDCLFGKLGFIDDSVLVTAKDKIVSLDFLTGEKVWEITFKSGKCYPARKTLIIDEDVVYLGTPEPLVYSLDAESGDIIWTFCPAGKSFPDLHIFEGNLVVVSEEMVCLKKETGEKVWEITDSIFMKKFFHDKILFRARKDRQEYCALVDICSGTVIWKENASEVNRLNYDDRRLYLGLPENRVVSLNPETGEELWSYTYRGTLAYVEILEDGVILLTYSEGIFDNLIFLDKTGSKMWDYPLYERITEWYSSAEPDIEKFRNIIFFIREGFIDALFAETGENLWRIEVKGNVITSFEVYENRVYFSENYGKFYCLNLETGEVMWFYDAGEELIISFYGDDRNIFVSKIENNVIFVATDGGRLFAFSLAEPVRNGLPWIGYVKN